MFNSEHVSAFQIRQCCHVCRLTADKAGAISQPCDTGSGIDLCVTCVGASGSVPCGGMTPRPDIGDIWILAGWHRHYDWSNRAYIWPLRDIRHTPLQSASSRHARLMLTEVCSLACSQAQVWCHVSVTGVMLPPSRRCDDGRTGVARVSSRHARQCVSLARHARHKPGRHKGIQ